MSAETFERDYDNFYGVFLAELRFFKRMHTREEYKMIIEDIKKENQKFDYNPDAYVLVSKSNNQENKYEFLDYIETYILVLKALKYNVDEIQGYKELYENKIKYVIEYINDGFEIHRIVNMHNILDYILIDKFGLSSYFEFVKQFKDEEYKKVVDATVEPLVVNLFTKE